MNNQEAIQMLKSKLDGTVDTSYKWCECVRLAINALETADVKHGRWKYYKNNGIIDTYICTNCQGKVEMAIDVEPSKFKYCPNCGADMRNDSNLMETEVDGLYLNIPEENEEGQMCETCRYYNNNTYWCSRYNDTTYRPNCSSYQIKEG